MFAILMKKTSLILCCASLVVSCSTPPERNPMGAMELATTQLPTYGETPVIAELPQATPVALKEINHVGQFPNVQTLSSKSPATPASSKGADTFELNFEQVELRQVIEIIADELGVSMVIDPTIGDKVTIRTPKEKPLRKADLWPLMQLLLTDTGISMEKKGGVYHLKKTGVGTGLPANVGVSSGLIGSDASEAMQITPLRYINADAALAVLTPLIQPQGRIISLPSLNVIGIIASPDRLERINRLLTVVDADPFQHRGMRLFRLSNSKSTEVQAELEKILQAISGNAPAYQVIGLERINSVLVIAPPQGSFTEVASWIEVLDERSEDSAEQVFIYRVKNLEAKELAATLAEVFKTDDAKDKDKTTKRTDELPPVAAIPAQPGQPATPTPEPKSTAPTGSVLAVSAKLKVNLVADEKTNSLIVRATPRDYKQLLTTIAQLDRVAKEVMVNVVIAEVTLNEATQFGIDWRGLFGKHDSSYGYNAKLPAGNLPGADLSSNTAIGSLAGFSVNLLSGDIFAVLNLLASTNAVSILSRPSILIRDNEDATFNVGSNEPYLGDVTRATVSGQSDIQSIQYRDTGITLKVTPRISEDGIVNLKLSQELTQLGPESSTVQNAQSFSQRKLETVVAVRDRTPIVLGGLIQNKGSNERQEIPGISKIPLVGETLFSSRSDSGERTELVLIIVPEIINPDLDNSVIVQNFRLRMQKVQELLASDYDVLLEDGRKYIPAKATTQTNTQQ
ncbi:type II secretion system secretin GspD [Beggiatoa leptomitoformis]|uniref:Type II secretion system secretin GspD n=1 Tax=Beggiatoa leptomitoformis TaxID=288004 RepID=A0A2N9YF79_9GAMM|nr:type II secretion system secretin GspD [Beggiatoa leptomitoformis]ALG68559.1 type II secretion system secretin GspD [Beggiatoa leptomitoformis]AUI69096.1 type II secretion system secretin GspD [Beggiatoa leptomitoformis]